MSAADWLVAGTTLAYLGASALYFLQGKMGHGIMFAGYAIANVGVVIAARQIV